MKSSPGVHTVVEDITLSHVFKCFNNLFGRNDWKLLTYEGKLKPKQTWLAISVFDLLVCQVPVNVLPYLVNIFAMFSFSDIVHILLLLSNLLGQG